MIYFSHLFTSHSFLINKQNQHWHEYRLLVCYCVAVAQGGARVSFRCLCHYSRCVVIQEAAVIMLIMILMWGADCVCQRCWWAALKLIWRYRTLTETQSCIWPAVRYQTHAHTLIYIKHDIYCTSVQPCCQTNYRNSETSMQRELLKHKNSSSCCSVDKRSSVSVINL